MKGNKGQPNFFRPTGNPMLDIAAAGLNILAHYTLQRFSREVAERMGVSGLSAQQQMALGKQKVSLERAQEELSRFKKFNVREIELLELRIQAKRLEMNRAQKSIQNAEIEAEQLQVPANDDVICGALEVVPDPKGLTGSSEQLEAYNRWLDSIQEGKVILITGSRGSGKTCLGVKIAEFASASFRMPVFCIGLPPEARQLLPNWITLANDPMQCPVGSLILVDEAGIEYCATLFSTSRNRFMSALLMICRQRHC